MRPNPLLLRFPTTSGSYRGRILWDLHYPISYPLPLGEEDTVSLGRQKILLV